MKTSVLIIKRIIKQMTVNLACDLSTNQTDITLRKFSFCTTKTEHIGNKRIKQQNEK